MWTVDVCIRPCQTLSVDLIVRRPIISPPLFFYSNEFKTNLFTDCARFSLLQFVKNLKTCIFKIYFTIIFNEFCIFDIKIPNI